MQISRLFTRLPTKRPSRVQNAPVHTRQYEETTPVRRMGGSAHGAEMGMGVGWKAGPAAKRLPFQQLAEGFHAFRGDLADVGDAGIVDSDILGVNEVDRSAVRSITV